MKMFVYLLWIQSTNHQLQTAVLVVYPVWQRVQFLCHASDNVQEAIY